MTNRLFVLFLTFFLLLTQVFALTVSDENGVLREFDSIEDYNNYIAAQQGSQAQEESSSSSTSASSIDWNFIIWFLNIAVFIVIFVLFVRNIKMTSKSYSRRSPNYERRRSKDAILTQSLDKVRKKREDREKIKKAIMMKKKQKAREKSEFEKQKMKDLSRKSRMSHDEVPIDHETVEIPKRELEEHERAPQTKSRHQKELPKKKTIREKLFGKKKQELPSDPFTQYIFSKRNEQGWDSTKKYRESYHLEQLAKAEEERRAKEEEERLKLKKIEIEEEQRRRKIEESKPKPKEEEPEKFHKGSLDDYLKKRTKKKKSYFIERFVDRDLRHRSRK